MMDISTFISFGVNSTSESIRFVFHQTWKVFGLSTFKYSQSPFPSVCFYHCSVTQGGCVIIVPLVLKALFTPFSIHSLLIIWISKFCSYVFRFKNPVLHPHQLIQKCLILVIISFISTIFIWFSDNFYHLGLSIFQQVQKNLYLSVEKVV